MTKKKHPGTKRLSQNTNILYKMFYTYNIVNEKVEKILIAVFKQGQTLYIQKTQHRRRKKKQKMKKCVNFWSKSTHYCNIFSKCVMSADQHFFLHYDT